MLIKETHFPLLRRLQAGGDQIILCQILFIWKEIKAKFESIRSILRPTVLQRMWPLSICICLWWTVCLLQCTKMSSQRIHKHQLRQSESSLPLKHTELSSQPTDSAHLLLHLCSLDPCKSQIDTEIQQKTTQVSCPTLERGKGTAKFDFFPDKGNELTPGTA